MPSRDVEPEDLDRCRAGDPRGLEAVYDALGDRVFRLCRGVLGHDADAEDAAQEVLIRILAKAPTFDGRARFSTWVHRLTVNHALNFRRGRERRRRPGDGVPADLRVDPAPTPPEAAAREEARGLLDRLLAELPAEARVVLTLREIEGLSYREISEALDVPIGTVMSRLSRARARLIRHGAHAKTMMESRS